MSSATKPRSRQRRLFRALVVVALLLVVVAMLASWAWIESNAGQETVRVWLERRGTELLGRAVRIGSLELDLLPFDALLNDIQVDGGPGSDELLLRVDSARLRVGPWALLSRQLLIRALEVDSPVVHWDVPAGPEGLKLSTSGDRRLSVVIESLSIEGGALEINHQRWNLDTSLTEVSLGLQPAEGLPGITRVRSGFLSIGGGGLHLAPGAAEGLPASSGSLDVAEAVFRFTVGNNLLRIDSGRLVVGNSELSTRGTVTDWSDGDFVVEARIEVADLVALAGIESEGEYRGEVRLGGTFTFGDEPLHFAGTLSAPTIVIAGIEVTDLSAEIDATRDRLLADTIQASLYGGSVAARIETELGPAPRAWSLDYEAADINLSSLTAAPRLQGFRFAGVASGRGSFGWQAPVADTITGSGSFDVALPPGT
ncbi:MAG: hypothetical protein IH849_10080, partial [Acidobacteria bacterium]|nr:hypothetical protein [Acidobacteriota bacterium]